MHGHNALYRQRINPAPKTISVTNQCEHTLEDSAPYKKSLRAFYSSDLIFYLHEGMTESIQ